MAKPRLLCPRMPSPLASCWLIIEAFVIPEGYRKWFYLSFYIHPVFLCFCQIFLWIKLLWRWYLILILFLSRLILWVSSSFVTIIRFLKKIAFLLVAPTRVAAGSTRLPGDEDMVEILQNDIPQVLVPSQNQVFTYAFRPSLCNGLSVETYCEVDSVFTAKIIETEAVFMNENPSLIQVDDSDDSSISFTPCVEVELDSLDTESDAEGSAFAADSFDTSPALSSANIFNLANLELEFHGDENHEIVQPIFVPSSPVESEFMDRSVKVEELDPVYVKYEERMKWFDLLSLERAYGIGRSLIINKFLTGISKLPDQHDNLSNDFLKSSIKSFYYYGNIFDCCCENWSDAIKNMQFWMVGFLESMVPAGLLEQTREKLMKSLSRDYELVYVAQSCLSWEALQHQYRKVEEAIADSDEDRFFHKYTAERFREFHVLLERFVEDEHVTSGQRHSNYVHRRFSQKKLLQVPQLSSIENDSITEEVVNVKATQVLKIIENCIKVFWVFVKSDSKKKSTWKLNNYSHPPVEDPRDLELLYDLRKTVRKKELQLENSEGKIRSWWRRAVHPDQGQMENQKIDDFLVATIDLKLVKNVLQMSSISNSQLNWCREKLNHIEIRQRKVHRTQHTELYPS